MKSQIAVFFVSLTFLAVSGVQANQEDKTSESTQAVSEKKVTPLKETPLVQTTLTLATKKAEAAPAPPKPIKVVSTRGPISDLSLPAKTTSWSMKSKVGDRLSLKLGPAAETKIQLHPHLVLTAFENTEFEIPSISWETRQFKEIKLMRGVLRLEVEDGIFDFNVTTPFFELTQPTGLWVYNIDVERALADIMGLQGILEVSTLNSDDKVTLHSGEKVTFRGLLEEGEIAYDLLLKGRKIPKGHWTEVEKLTSTDMQKYSLESERKRMQQEQKDRVASARKQAMKVSKATCLKPVGDLGECVWKKEGAKCYRSRCTAGGEWKDRQVVAPSRCEKEGGWTPSPKTCDY